MGERIENDAAARQEVKTGLSRRKFVQVAGMGALLGGLAFDAVFADDITPATLKSMEKQYADIPLSEEEAGALAPFVDFFTKGIRGIDLSEEVEPATVFRRRKEK